MPAVRRVSAAALLSALFGGLCACSSQSASPPSDETADSAEPDVWAADDAGSGRGDAAIPLGFGGPDGSGGTGGDASSGEPIAVGDTGGSDSSVGDADGSNLGDAGGSNPDASHVAGGEDGSTFGDDGGGCKGLFCEDFETGKIDPSLWAVQTDDGQTVEVQSTVVAHGKYAVHFHAMPNVLSYDFIVTKNAPAALRTHFFGRTYLYVTPKAPDGHMEFIFGGSEGASGSWQPMPKLKYLEVAENTNEWQLTYVTTVATTQENYYLSKGTYPLAKWFCLEWEMNDSPDQINVWVDGASSATFDQIDFQGQSSGLVGGFADFGFGAYIWHPPNFAFDLYYDDIVLDTKRVGCL